MPDQILELNGLLQSILTDIGHHLLSEQEKALNTMKLALTNMQNSLDTMILDAHHFDLRHTDNACARIPALIKKGLENRLQKILPSQPPQIIIHPGTPANSVQSEPLPSSQTQER